MSPNSGSSPKHSSGGSPTYVTSVGMSYQPSSGQHAVNASPYGSQEPGLHSAAVASNVACGNVSPYYASINHGSTYQIYHPLQSISASPPPPQSVVNLTPPTASSAGPLYGNVGNAPLANYNYGSSWHPGDYFPNYHYQGATTSDYVPVGGEIE